jgi:hypothetical protein
MNSIVIVLSLICCVIAIGEAVNIMLPKIQKKINTYADNIWHKNSNNQEENH